VAAEVEIKKCPSVEEEEGGDGPGYSGAGCFDPGWSHDPGPKGPGTKGSFVPGSWHHPGPKGVLEGRGETFGPPLVLVDLQPGIKGALPPIFPFLSFTNGLFSLICFMKGLTFVNYIVNNLLVQNIPNKVFVCLNLIYTQKILLLVCFDP
jgi:hypothetical protein